MTRNLIDVKRLKIVDHGFIITSKLPLLELLQMVVFESRSFRSVGEGAAQDAAGIRNVSFFPVLVVVSVADEVVRQLVQKPQHDTDSRVYVRNTRLVARVVIGEINHHPWMHDISHDHL